MDENAAQDDRVCDTAIMKELESVQAENQALKAHLVTQLEEMRMENAELRRNLEVANASSVLVSALKEEIKVLKDKLQTAESIPQPHAAEDVPVKHFNSIPRNLEQFYDQMLNGDETQSRFSDLEEFKGKRSTKG